MAVAYPSSDRWPCTLRRDGLRAVQDNDEDGRRSKSSRSGQGLG